MASGGGSPLRTRPIRLAAVPLLLAAAALAACGAGGDEAANEGGAASSAFAALTAITAGDRGVILIEWTGGPDNATRWQYRQRGPENDWKWTAWTDIPGSDASTRSYRVSGLREYSAYYFEVRAVVGTIMGEPSEEARGVTAEIDGHGIPVMPRKEIIEGGRTWRVGPVGPPYVLWEASDGPSLEGFFGLVVIDVPVGTRLRYVGDGLGVEWDVATVADVESGLRFHVDHGTAEIHATGRGRHHPPFAAIAASARMLPPNPAPAAPTVITITTGDRGVILLEWTGGPDNATRWQYRQRAAGAVQSSGWVWTAWTDIPGSDAGTRSYRVSGLRDSSYYYFEVRAEVRAVGGVVGGNTVMGEPSEEAQGVTAELDGHGIPMMPLRQIIEGGRTWRGSAHSVAGDVAPGFVIDVPAGTRLRYVGDVFAEGRVVGTVADVESGSQFHVNVETAEILGRTIVTPPTPAGAGTSPRDVGALFDRIAASARVLPPK